MLTLLRVRIIPLAIREELPVISILVSTPNKSFRFTAQKQSKLKSYLMATKNVYNTKWWNI